VIRESEYEGEQENVYAPEAEFESQGGDMEVLNRMHYYASRAATASSDREADHFLGAITSIAGPLLSSLLGESEGEEEDMEDLEDEADPFLPALIPLAAKALPIAAKVLPHALPFLKRGVSAIGRLFRESEAEQATRAIPTIIAATTTKLAKKAQAGKPIGKKDVIATLARQTAKTVASKPALTAAVQQNRAATRRVQAARA